MDSKEYNIAGKELRVSVLETTAPRVLLDRKAALMAAMPGALAMRSGVANTTARSGVAPPSACRTASQASRAAAPASGVVLRNEANASTRGSYGQPDVVYAALDTSPGDWSCSGGCEAA